MKVLVIEPLKDPYAVEIDGKLETMQKIVGGLIQMIIPFDDPEIALICNDEGKLMGLPPNRALYDDKGNIVDIISGNFFICSAPANSDSFEGLTDEQIKTYTKRFESIEIFFQP